jgi:hypothetical protein
VSIQALATKFSIKVLFIVGNGILKQFYLRHKILVAPLLPSKINVCNINFIFSVSLHLFLNICTDAHFLRRNTMEEIHRKLIYTYISDTCRIKKKLLENSVVAKTQTCL